MKSKTLLAIIIASALIAFGAGLLTGLVVFRRPGIRIESKSARARENHSFALSATSQGNRGSNSALREETALPKLSTTTLADLKALFTDSPHGDWNRILLVTAAFDTNEFAEGITASFEAEGSSASGRWVADLLAARWAAIDPQKALAFLQSLMERKSEWALQIGGYIVEEWSGKDPNAALAWAKQLPRGQMRQIAFNCALPEFEKHDAASAVTSLLKLPDGLERNDLLKRIVWSWAEQDPNAARAWASSLPAGSMRLSVLPSVVFGWTRTDPKAASDYVHQLSDDDERIDCIHSVMDAWVSRDPRAAVAWMAQLPKDDQMPDLFHFAVLNWPKDDPDGFEEWIATVSDRDHLLEMRAGMIQQNDPARALRLISMMDDEEKRSGLMQNVAKDWLRIDESAAKAWVAESQLPEDFKKNFANQKP